MLKGSARSLARGLGWSGVRVINVVGIRIGLVRIVIANEASLFLLGASASCRAGKALRVGLDQTPELWMNWES